MRRATKKEMLRDSPFAIRETEYTDKRLRGEKYRFYLVEGRDRSGKRIRRKFQKYEDAVECKGQLDLNFWNDGTALRSVWTKFSDRQLTELDHCLSRLSGRYGLTSAVDFFLDHHGDVENPTPLSRAIDQFRTEAESRVRDRTLIQLRSSMRQFEEFAGKDTLVHEITTDVVTRFLTGQRARNGTDPAAPKTWNNLRADLHLFFEWCIKSPRRWITLNPAAEIERKQVEHGHIQILTADQSKELMDYLSAFGDGHLVPFFALALFVGIRPGGELLKLHVALQKSPNLIDLDNKVIRISATISKTKRPRQIRIRPNLTTWLRAFQSPILPENHDREIKRVRAEFGLSHDVLRHTFISMHVAKFKSFARAAIESGNSEKIIRDHYLNVVSLKDAQAFWKILPPGKG
jgi:hypothetical protein